MIAILDPGPQTTIQDLGRTGQLHCGVPPAGAMDRFAFVVANRLAGNADGAAAMECTLAGPRFTAQHACAMAVTGAEMPITINGAAAPGWTTLSLRPGDEVKLGTARTGLRGYVAIGGGIDVPLVLGSRSTYLRGGLGGWHGRALKKGDRLAVFASNMPRPWRLADRAIPRYSSEIVVKAVLGPQRDRFTAQGLATFLSMPYAMLPQSDRMGARLCGAPIAHAAGHDIVSDGIALGSVQVPGDGQPIILLLDRQSTGGYTKIATVCSFEIGRVGQLRPGQAIRFEAVGVEEAHRLLREAASMLDQLPREECA
jgi:antagonist of KipI